MTNPQTETTTSYDEAKAAVLERNEKGLETRARRVDALAKAEAKIKTVENTIAVCQNALEKHKEYFAEKQEELEQIDAWIEEAVEARMRAEEMRPAFLASGEAFYSMTEAQQAEAKPARDAILAELTGYDRIVNELSLKIAKKFYKK